MNPEAQTAIADFTAALAKVVYQLEDPNDATALIAATLQLRDAMGERMAMPLAMHESPEGTFYREASGSYREWLRKHLKINL